MAETVTPPAEPSPVERPEYQPLSVLALAAIGVSGLFVAILLVVAVTAFVSHKPVILAPLLVLPVIGLILAVAGRLQIQRSEGARAGMGLVKAAWWLSVVGGAGYAAYIAAVEAALRQQSLDFAEEWFAALRDGELHRAFVLTLDPAVRAGVNPSRPEEIENRFGDGSWAGFRENQFIQFLRRNAGESEIRHRGLKSWEQKPAGFDAVQTFTIRCPEGEFDVIVSLTAQEGVEDAPRQWKVNFLGDNHIQQARMTAYGRLVGELHTSARTAGGRVLQALQGKRPREAYRLARDPAAQQRQEERLRALGGLAPLAAAAAAHLGAAAGGDPPGYEEFLAGSLLRGPDGRPLSAEKRAMFRTLWEQGQIGYAGRARRSLSPPGPSVTVGADAITARYPIEILSPAGTEYSTGLLILLSRDPNLLAEAQRLRAEGAAAPERTDPSTASLLRHFPPNWQLDAIETDLEMEPLPGPEMMREAGL